MTCIVAYKKDNKIYFGADSLGSTEYKKSNRRDQKLFYKDNMLIGFTSSFRMGNILQYKLEIPKHKSNISTNVYMNTIFIDNVIKCFEDNKYISNVDSTISGGTFLVGYKNRIFKIESDFQVAEDYGNFSSCGSGEDIATGVMEGILKINKNIAPEKLIKIAIQIASKYIPSVGGPIHIKAIDKNGNLLNEF